MASGGKRKGAGRKKGGVASHTLEAQEARKLVVDMVAHEIVPITQALIDAAKGYKNKGGYRSRPDVYAAKELFERAFGKVTDKLQIQEVKKMIKLE